MCVNSRENRWQYHNLRIRQSCQFKLCQQMDQVGGRKTFQAICITFYRANLAFLFSRVKEMKEYREGERRREKPTASQIQTMLSNQKKTERKKGARNRN